VILAKGAKTNLPDNQPWVTPLFWAEHKGYDDIAELLRQHGATELSKRPVRCHESALGRTQQRSELSLAFVSVALLLKGEDADCTTSRYTRRSTAKLSLSPAVTGSPAIPDAIEIVYPKTQVQLCIVYMVRNSLAYVSWKDRKTVAADLKAIY